MRSVVLSITLVSLWPSAPATAQLPVEVHPRPETLLDSSDTTLAANKRLVFDFYRLVVDARRPEHATEFLADDYVEHSPGGASGRAGFVQSLAGSTPLPPRAAPNELVAIVAERDLVVLAFRRELLDLEHEGETYTTTWFDLYRVADGKIVEHWDFGPRDD